MKFALLFLLAAGAWAQPPASGIESGRALFRSNCAFCHGLTAKGGRGPNLVSAPLNHGDTDAAIGTVIRTGVPGTTMPAFSDFTNEELGHILEFLHSLSTSTTRQQHIPGDPKQGREVYAHNGCSGCHRIGEEGSIFGPDLTRIGAARPVEYLRESIVDPSADVPEGYQTVSVTTRDGKKISGIRVNEDTFSVQLRDVSGRFEMFQKEDVRDVASGGKSMMPPYANLAPADLQNLVAYLATLKGAAAPGALVEKAKGIK